MKITYFNYLLRISCAMAALTWTSHLQAADLAESDKEFLTRYEQVGAALAAEDLSAAQKAAAELGEDGAALAKSDKIATARAEFAKLSDRAIKMAAGQSGYYVVNCPMLKERLGAEFSEDRQPVCGQVDAHLRRDQEVITLRGFSIPPSLRG